MSLTSHRYSVLLTRFEPTPTGGVTQRVELAKNDLAPAMVVNLIAAAVTVAEGDPAATEQLRRVCVTTLERLTRD